jgi:hypothetical protein
MLRPTCVIRAAVRLVAASAQDNVRPVRTANLSSPRRFAGNACTANSLRD